MIRVFIGYDPREAVAFSVLSHSIHTRSSEPVAIAPLMLSQLKREMWRERNPLQSTDFSFSRFLTPSLSGFEGWSIFMDCDMLVLDDIAKLWALRDERYAVMCIKHDHQPREDIKFLDAVQTKYEKKNWSSVMIFNNRLCQKLTLEYVNRAHGLDLHQFTWCEDHQIAGMPKEWNWLVGEEGYDATGDPKLIHYTKGTPCFPDYAEQDFAELWRAEREAMLAHA